MKLKQSRWRGVDRVWDTSYYPPEHLVGSCQAKVIRGQEVKKVPQNVGLGGTIHISRSDFRKEAKNDPIKFFNDPYRRIIQNTQNDQMH